MWLLPLRGKKLSFNVNYISEIFNEYYKYLIYLSCSFRYEVILEMVPRNLQYQTYICCRSYVHLNHTLVRDVEDTLSHIS